MVRGLLACSNDSGVPETSYLYRCWLYDPRRGWAPEAKVILLVPIGLVVAGSALAAISGRRAILAGVTVAALALAIAAFFAAPLFYE